MTVVEFDLGRYLFRATGSVMVFDGFHVLYTEGREKEEGRQVEDLPPIPPLAQGDRVEVQGDHAVAALHRAAAALLRGQPGEGAGAARHRPAVHLQRHHLDALGPGVREGGAAPVLPHRAGRAGGEDHGGQVPRDLQRRVHLRHGERARPDRGRRARLAARARGVLRAVHQGARRGGHDRARGRRARARPRGAGQGALPQVRLARSSSRPGGSGPTWPA